MICLQDPMMQELLPFGEYVSPEHAQPAQHLYMGLEAWELERILARLAVSNNAAALHTGRRRGHSRAEPVVVSGIKWSCVANTSAASACNSSIMSDSRVQHVSLCPS